MSRGLDDGFAAMIARRDNLTDADAMRIDALVDNAERERVSVPQGVVDGPRPQLVAISSAKVLIMGGFASGKTTFLGAASEIAAPSFEADITDMAVQDEIRLHGLRGKTRTTVASEYGRTTISPDLTAYLFSVPSPIRFWWMWDEIAHGAAGAVVLVDTRRITDAFITIDYLNHKVIPYILAVNCFDGLLHHRLEDIREVLGLDDAVPVVTCDARLASSTKQTVATLIDHVSHRRGASIHAIAAG